MAAKTIQKAQARYKKYYDHVACPIPQTSELEIESFVRQSQEESGKKRKLYLILGVDHIESLVVMTLTLHSVKSLLS